MHEITNSLVKLAKEIELNFILIKKLLPLKQKKLVKSVTTISDNYAADIIVCNADIHTVYDKLIPSAKKLKEVDKQERSVPPYFYWGLTRNFLN
jgi:phytoene dehydrogenase-like protein